MFRENRAETYGIMEAEKIRNMLAASPVIAAVRREEELTCACRSSADLVFILHADIMDAAELSRRAREAGKAVFLHADLIEGLAAGSAAMRYLHEVTAADGIISTRSQIVRTAKEFGFVTIQRFFVVDSRAEENVCRTAVLTQPDFLELMPGLIFPVIERLSEKISAPIIAGGLIETKEQILKLLSAGAAGVSTGCAKLWDL